MRGHTEHPDDAAQLAAHGHVQELNRNFSPLYEAGVPLDIFTIADIYSRSSMLGLAFAILNVTPKSCYLHVLFLITS